MNKAELAEVLAGKNGITKSEAEKTINTILDIITEQMKTGQEVTLTGFGAFSVSTRAGRVGVNPQNPTEKIQIPATKVPKFKAGKSLKEAVRS